MDSIYLSVYCFLLYGLYVSMCMILVYGSAVIDSWIISPAVFAQFAYVP